MTIRELAKICNVHYNTMRKWLSDNNIEKSGEQLNSGYLITKEVIEKAKGQFLNKPLEAEKGGDKTDNILFQQLSIKDEQIVRQQEQIDHLQRLLENQQILTLKAQDKVERLENKEKDQLEDLQGSKKKWKFWVNRK